MSYSTNVERDARLRILQALQRQTDGRLGEALLEPELENWGHRPTRDWIRTQMRDLAALGAVTLPVDNAAVLVAEITRKGLDHVRRRTVIEGVLAPDPGE